MMSRQHFPIMIVGAGPGDPDLLTVKAMRLISVSIALAVATLIVHNWLKWQEFLNVKKNKKN